MKNFLNQELTEGSVVYVGEKQGSHGRMVGILYKDHGNGSATVIWHFELFSEWVGIDRAQVVRIPSLVGLDESVLASIYHPEGE